MAAPGSHREEVLVGSPIALMNMPFGTLLQPSLALGQIQAQLRQAGLDSRIHNLMFHLAEAIGIGSYEIVARLRGADVELGEWLFAPYVWGEGFGPTLEEFLARSGKEVESLEVLVDPIPWLTKVRNEILPDFLDRSCDLLLADGDLKVAGFSCLSFQTMASLALAKRLKERAPHVKMVFGGASFHRGMGEEFIAKVPWIDAVATGEADSEVVPLFQALVAGEPPPDLPGIHVRLDDGMIVRGPCNQMASSETLEKLPSPDFDDYFQEIRRLGLDRDHAFMDRIFIPYEASRGCWWGQIKHCTYCGLNAEGMDYRFKSSERSIEILKDLAGRYPTRRYIATDNILPNEYYETFLPDWAKERPKDLTIFYEIRPTINEKQMKLLTDAGVIYSVPGVESLNSHLLELFQKGARAIQNVFFLKLARMYGMYPLWNLLIRVPGEKSEDYRQMADLMPKIVHYMPPFGGPRDVELHRFSPFFMRWPEFADNIKPRPWYHDIYPDQFDRSQIAYYFDAEWKDVLPAGDRAPTVQATWQWIDAWRESTSIPGLLFDEGQAQGPLDLWDTRGGKKRQFQLDDREAAVYRAIREPLGVSKIKEKVGDLAGDEVGLRSMLADLVANDLAMEEGGRYLALAIPDTSPEPSQAIRRNVLARVGQEAER